MIRALYAYRGYDVTVKPNGTTTLLKSAGQAGAIKTAGFGSVMEAKCLVLLDDDTVMASMASLNCNQQLKSPANSTSSYLLLYMVLDTWCSECKGAGIV